MKYCGSLTLHTAVGSMIMMMKIMIVTAVMWRVASCVQGMMSKLPAGNICKSIASDFTEWHLEGYKYRFDMFPVVFQIPCSLV